MSRWINKISFVALLSFCMTLPELIALEIGDTAPEIRLDKYLKGEAKTPQITPPKPGQYLIVNFWATWCKSCGKYIPIFNEIAGKYGESGRFSIIAITPERGVPANHIMLSMMEYPVANDLKETTYKNFIPEDKEFPVTFIIDSKNKVIWKGSPLQIEEAVNEIESGRYSMAAAAADYKLRNELRIAISEKKFGEAYKIIDELLSKDPGEFAMVDLKMVLIGRQNGIEKAIKYIDGEIKKQPKSLPLYEIKAQFLLHNRQDEAIKDLYVEMANVFRDSPLILSTLAQRFMHSGSGVTPEKLTLATGVIDKALAAPKQTDEERFATYMMAAEVCYAIGRAEDAVRYQELALKSAGKEGTDVVEKMKEKLKFYQTARDLGKIKFKE